jgi:hypothetical protein
MTTRIEKDFNITSAVHFSDKFLINYYNIKISLLVETDNVREQNIAMERLEYFLNEVISHGIFIDSNLQDVIEKYNKAGIRIITLPEEPYDQIIGMIILLKCNSIMENRLVITDLSISSKLSDNVRFCLVTEIAETIFAGDYWWNNIGLNTFDIEKSNSKKVVKLFDNEWTELGLTWKDKKVAQTT